MGDIEHVPPDQVTTRPAENPAESRIDMGYDTVLIGHGMAEVPRVHRVVFSNADWGAPAGPKRPQYMAIGQNVQLLFSRRPDAVICAENRFPLFRAMLSFAVASLERKTGSHFSARCFKGPR
jgi:hypothetical protein